MRTMGPLQLAVTWYKIRHAGEQAVHWDMLNKATSSRQICIFFVLDVPVRSLLSSMVDFVPCDRQLQRAHCPKFNFLSFIFTHHYYQLLKVVDRLAKAPNLSHGLLLYICYYESWLWLFYFIPSHYCPTRVLRSSNKKLLQMTKYNLERYGGRSFSVAAPFLWNALPDNLRNCRSLAIFKSKLKPFLFNKGYFNY